MKINGDYITTFAILLPYMQVSPAMAHVVKKVINENKKVSELKIKAAEVMSDILASPTQKTLNGDIYPFIVKRERIKGKFT
jgi:hypothetical protein